MGNRWADEWQDNHEVYTEAQVEAILNACGIEIESETFTHFLCLCPFHGNTDSAAFAINKSKGLWNCFNPSCNKAGKLEDLPAKLLKMNIFQTKRLILRYENANAKSLIERADERERGKELPAWSKDDIVRLQKSFWNSEDALVYMRDRGFDDETLNFFKVGYSLKKNIVTVPMYAENEIPVGVIGRRIPPVDFKFRHQNSTGLPKRLIPFNIHNAKKHGDTVIICEGAYDAMSIHQSGYPNVIAVLGGHLSVWHQQIIDKIFTKVIIMTDFDQKRFDINCIKCKSAGNKSCIGHREGRDFGRQIVNAFPHKRVMWATYDNSHVYPEHVKDANGILEKFGDEPIRQCLKNSISNFEYNKWNIESSLAS